MNRIFITILCFLLLTTLAMNTLVAANVDTSHSFIEDNKLLDDHMFIGNCSNNDISCVKYLVRYDGFYEFVDELKDWKKNVEDDVETSFWWPLFRKGLAGIGGPVLTYFYPLNALKAITSLSAYCHLENDIGKPVGDTAREILESPSSMWNKVSEFFGKKKDRVLNPNNGLIGDFKTFLCGDGQEDGQRVTIKKEQKEKFINEIFKELKSEIKKKKYQGNEIIVLALDYKNLEYGLKFDVVEFNPNYDKPLDKYFKSRHWYCWGNEL